MNRLVVWIINASFSICSTIVLLSANIAPAIGGPAVEYLPKDIMLTDQDMDSPVANSAFFPGSNATKADPFHATLVIKQTELNLNRQLAQPVCDGRKVQLGGSCRGGADKRLFPAITGLVA